MRKLLSTVILLCMILGVVGLPVNAASKKATKMIHEKGLLVPIGKNWNYIESEDVLTIYAEKEGEPDEIHFVVASESIKKNTQAKKLAKLLAEKSSISKVYKAIKKLDFMSTAEFTKKDVTLKKDTNGKYMAILNFSMDTEKDYLVFRNVDDRFIVLYGAGVGGKNGKLDTKTKKNVLKNAQKIVTDDIGMSLTLLNEIVIPYPEEWETDDRSQIQKEDDDVLLYADERVGVQLRAVAVEDDEECALVAPLFSDKANFEKLKKVLTEFMGISVEDNEFYPYEVTFSMESDGHGSNYFLIDAGMGLAVIRIIDGKYMIDCEVLDESYEVLTSGMRDKVIKMVNDSFIG